MGLPAWSLESVYRIAAHMNSPLLFWFLDWKRKTETEWKRKYGEEACGRLSNLQHSSSPLSSTVSLSLCLPPLFSIQEVTGRRGAGETSEQMEMSDPHQATAWGNHLSRSHGRAALHVCVGNRAGARHTWTEGKEHCSKPCLAQNRKLFL